MSEALRHNNFEISKYLKDVTTIKNRINGLFSIIVTCYEETYEQIAFCLDTILKQDYENYEVIVCFDKPDHKDYNKLKRKYKSKKKISFHKHDNMGSSGNKNYGMLLSNGEFIACMAGDMIMNKGAISNFIEYFNQNKEASIIYTGYEFLREKNKKLNNFNSYQTDKHKIKAANAIDASMPQRYDKAIMFDTAFKSLGDWDWAITHLVHYDHEVVHADTFFAYKHTIPPATGLSAHSSKHWIEILDYLCLKHKLESFENRTNIISMDNSHHAIKLSEKTGWDLNINAIRKQYKYKDCLILGFYRGNWEDYMNCISLNSDTNFSILFIGSDIAALNYLTYNEILGMIEFLNHFNVKVFSECERTKNELSKFGIESNLLWLPVDKPEVTNDEPKEFTVAVYIPHIPANEHYKYGLDFIIRLFAILPNFKFIAYGGGGDNTDILPNVDFIGWKPIGEVIAKSDVLLRIMPFDGLSISALEFMMCGKQVITNNELEGAFNIKLDRNFQFKPDKLEEAMNKVINTLYDFKYNKNSRFVEKLNPDDYTVDVFLNNYSIKNLKENCMEV